MSMNIHREESESRRPGITELAKEIAAEHPGWSAMRVMERAKLEYTNSGRRTLTPNSD